MSSGSPWATEIVNRATSAISLGSGLLGKSAVVVGPAVLLIIGVAFSMHSDGMKIATIAVAVVTLFLWYIPFIRFCEKHPVEALLDGVQYTAHHQMIIAAKGQSAIADSRDLSVGLEKPDQQREGKAG